MERPFVLMSLESPEASSGARAAELFDEHEDPLIAVSDVEMSETRAEGSDVMFVESKEAPSRELEMTSRREAQMQHASVQMMQGEVRMELQPPPEKPELARAFSPPETEELILSMATARRVTSTPRPLSGKSRREELVQAITDPNLQESRNGNTILVYVLFSCFFVMSLWGSSFVGAYMADHTLFSFCGGSCFRFRSLRAAQEFIKASESRFRSRSAPTPRSRPSGS